MAGTSTAPKLVVTSGGNAAFHNFNNDSAHISDPNKRRRLALAEIDKAPFGLLVLLCSLSRVLLMGVKVPHPSMCGSWCWILHGLL